MPPESPRIEEAPPRPSGDAHALDELERGQLRESSSASSLSGTASTRRSGKKASAGGAAAMAVPVLAEEGDERVFTPAGRPPPPGVLQPVADFLRRVPGLAAVERWFAGPVPPRKMEIRPWFPRAQGAVDRWTDLEALFSARKRVDEEAWGEGERRRRWRWKPLLEWGFLALWLAIGTVLVWDSQFRGGSGQTWVGCTDAFWVMDGQCGLNGTLCSPFTGPPTKFRCPAACRSVKLLNPRTVGSQQINYRPLLVGGSPDAAQTPIDMAGVYRGDSWICAAALQQSLFPDSLGGCVSVTQTGAGQGYAGWRGNGIESAAFESEFVSSYTVAGVGQDGCRDLRDSILAFDVVMSVILSLVIRPRPIMFFWTLFCVGYWHITLASDPASNPPDLSDGFGTFLPALFIGYFFWRSTWRFTLPAFEGALVDRTVWYLGGFWVGTLFNLTTGWIPLSRLTPHDISQQPGGLIAVIVLAIVGVALVVMQFRVIRNTGWFWPYARWYAMGIIVVGVLSAIPGLQFRFHHYFAALVLMPGTGFKTRPSALLQAFLMGMFLDGAARWGMDSILQTPAELQGDAISGSAIPSFSTNSSTFTPNQKTIGWNPIPADLSTQWDSFSLLVDDVVRYQGASTNFSLLSLALDFTLPHFFRVAYSLQGTPGDYTMPATAFVLNGSWIDPAPGAT